MQKKKGIVWSIRSVEPWMIKKVEKRLEAIEDIVTCRGESRRFSLSIQRKIVARHVSL